MKVVDVCLEKIISIQFVPKKPVNLVLNQFERMNYLDLENLHKTWKLEIV